VRDLLVVAGVIVVLVLLLAVFAEPGHSPSGPAGHAGRAEDAAQGENPAFVCLALAGGTALLAGLVWMGKLRMSTSGAASAKQGLCINENFNNLES